MRERVHEHINLELEINTKTDTRFMITGILYNFVMLFISWPLAENAADSLNSSYRDPSMGPLMVLGILLVLTVLVNGIAVTGLITGRATRQMLLQGLLKMYTDADVGEYYNPSLLTNYRRRYSMFIAILVFLGLAGILIPIAVFVTS